MGAVRGPDVWSPFDRQDAARVERRELIRELGTGLQERLVQLEADVLTASPVAQPHERAAMAVRRQEIDAAWRLIVQVFGDLECDVALKEMASVGGARPYVES